MSVDLADQSKSIIKRFTQSLLPPFTMYDFLGTLRTVFAIGCIIFLVNKGGSVAIQQPVELSPTAPARYGLFNPRTWEIFKMFIFGPLLLVEIEAFTEGLSPSMHLDNVVVGIMLSWLMAALITRFERRNGGQPWTIRMAIRSLIQSLTVVRLTPATEVHR